MILMLGQAQRNAKPAGRAEYLSEVVYIEGSV